MNIIIGIFDAGFETKDAVEKSNGFFATLFNGIVGAIGGFIDGAILSLADLIKDGVAWVAGLLGFEEVEKKLDEFSFSKVFNEMLDKIYNFFNELFNFDLAAMASSLIPEDSFLRKFVPESLFESKEKAVEKKTYKGGIVATRPTWLPSSGAIVGEHSTLDGYCAYSGGIPDGPAEMVIPLGSARAEAFVDPIAASISGQVMNQMAMERVAMQTTGMGASSAPIVTDNSTQIVNNNTTTTITNPIGQMLPGESDDFVRKVA